jgi:pimeloyl-ACP methyl ester carboxylesterase
VRMFDAIGSRVEREPGDIRAIAAASYDRDRDPRGMPRQLAAIIASGDRTAELRRISAPTLVIHGTSDPLVAASGGRATARAIPRAQLMLVANMGHDLPRVLWPQLLDAIGEHIVRAGGAPQRHPPLPTRPTSLSAG